MKILKHLFSIILVLAVGSVKSFAQGTNTDGPILQGCYQVITLDDTDPNQTPTVTMLKGSSNTARFKWVQPGPSSATWPIWYTFERYITDQYGSYWDFIDQGEFEDYFNVSASDIVNNPDGYIGLDALRARMEYDQEEWNPNVFDIDFTGLGTDLIRITPFYITGQFPNEEVLPGINDVILDFKYPGQISEFVRDESEHPGCNTFDDFVIDLEHSLEGFCADVTNIELTVGAAVPSGWPTNWEENIYDFDYPQDLNEPSGVCDECLNASAPWNYPEPVACGCVNLTIRVTIEPCPDAPEGCEDMTFVDEVEVCCDCDVRDSPPGN